MVRITRLGRTALYSYPVIMVGTGCISFFKQEENVIEGGYKINKKYKKLSLSTIPISRIGLEEPWPCE